VDWDKLLEDNKENLGAYSLLVTSYHRRMKLLRDLASDLSAGQFSRKDFYLLRARTGTREAWANYAAVSQSSIRNWEIGENQPTKKSLDKLAHASYLVADLYENRLEYVYSRSIGPKITRINPNQVLSALNDSILKAAFTDFDLDLENQRIEAIPFEADQVNALSDYNDDRDDLLSSLAVQAEIIIDNISEGVNINSDKLLRYLKKYQEECSKSEPNSRIVYRMGSILIRQMNDEEVRHAIASIDENSFDDFSTDHMELMRVYYRQALARAQEVDAASFDKSATEPSSEDFETIASEFEGLKSENGDAIVSEDAVVILRDVAREIRELRDAEDLAYSSNRKNIIKNRRMEAIKNGSIYVGRLLFCASMFVVILPNLAVAGSIASIIGVAEVASPGSVRKAYDRLRSSFPVLPPLPME